MGKKTLILNRIITFESFVVVQGLRIYLFNFCHTFYLLTLCILLASRSPSNTLKLELMQTRREFWTMDKTYVCWGHHWSISILILNISREIRDAVCLKKKKNRKWFCVDFWCLLTIFFDFFMEIIGWALCGCNLSAFIK